ncbi:hypothetical protein [Pseudoroseicyclus tamaricis]|uniref:Uncharacterized protein n=1 Tax=Pseudoroseicyclus tamaricis TaxID=2705421 RepID=A0A6B2JXN3_9RHOB|nr:hypothetical protein [Pseudoroseicyclus tamaricis]NDV02900.1 hypothetical protein [Pseudoroseicyclus tamaricis]
MIARAPLVAPVLATLLGLAAGSVAAQDFAPPEGCVGTLTVQQRACLVVNVWECEADAPGEQWVALFGVGGPFQVKKVDEDFQWLTTFYPDRVETMELPAPDPGSLSELLETGRDSYDFTTTSDDGAPAERVVGVDRLTGEEVEIDGEPLLATTYSYDVVTADGEITYSGVGEQYVSERHRLFLLGRSWQRDTPEEVLEASPVDFIYPGEPGFFSTSPQYDCGVIESALPGASQ